MRNAVLISAGYCLAALLLLSPVYDPVAVMNAVLIERGGFSAFELVHPLYSPVLGLLNSGLALAGVSGPHMPVFQALSAVSAGASAGLAYLLLASCGLPAAAAAGGALCAAFAPGSWYWAMQAKPYAPALFFSLLSLYLLAVPADRSWRRTTAASASLAAACGFTLACLALLPAFLLALARGRTSGEAWRAGGLFTACLALCLSVFCLPLLAMKWRAVSSLAAGGLFQALAAVPGGGSVLSSGSLARQAALLWERALAGNFTLAIAFGICAAGHFFGRRDAEPAPSAPAAAAVGAFCLLLFFLLADPHNDFAYAATFFAVLGGAFYLWRLKAHRGAFTALAAVSAALALWPSLPVSGGVRDVYRLEAEFLASRLGPEDTLFCAGPPDWRLAYLLGGRVKILQADLGGNEGNPFAPELLPPGPRLLARLKTASGGGRKVLLAADAMFRPEALWSREQTAARIDAAVSWTGRGFRFGEPEISPNGQHYYPLSLK